MLGICTIFFEGIQKFIHIFRSEGIYHEYFNSKIIDAIVCNYCKYQKGKGR